MEKMSYNVEVTDRLGKYPAKTYVVESTDIVFAAADAVMKYIKDNNHPVYTPGKSFSRYLSRFDVARIMDHGKEK